MAGVTGSAIYTLRGIERTYSRERIGNSHASRGGQIVGDALMEQRTALWLLVAGAPNESHQTYTASWKSFDTGLALTKSTDADPTVASAAKQLATDAQAYRRLANEVVTDNSPVLRPDVQKAVKDILEPKIAHLMSDATQLGDFARAASSDDNEAAKEASDSAIARAGWVIFGGLFVALGLGIRLVRAVISPLGALVARAEQIAEGDLSPHPKSARRDEIGALSNAIETMTERIREVRAIARKRLRRAEQMSDAALEHLYDPVIVLDQKSRIVHLNQAAEDLLGKIPDDQKVSVTDHIQDRRLAKALSMASASNKFCISEDEVESFILNSDGVRKIYRFRATPMKDEDGVPIGSVAMLEDITHFREVDRLKNEFIGVASHELRTPRQQPSAECAAFEGWRGGKSHGRAVGGRRHAASGFGQAGEAHEGPPRRDQARGRNDTPQAGTGASFRPL
jgi:NtrC-family two-component system sensor histidine kinase KinB